MTIFMKLLAIYQAIAPFITAANYQVVSDAFAKAVVDFKADNYQGVIDDLVSALKAILPTAVHSVIDAAA